MLAVSSLTNERETGFLMEDEEFTSENLVDSIDFDDIFVGFEVLPDLDMYQDFLPDDFSVSVVVGGDENSSAGNSESNTNNHHPCPESVSVSGSGSDVGFGSSSLIQGDEIMSKRDDDDESGKTRKSSSHSRKLPGKKKPKVDWTPELHRRFVEAVEQLGLDKAVPSRIREIMGVDTLTRHNIASHLQKYRSHRKHSDQWGQTAAKREVKPWIAPTMGFPPVTPMPHFTPLHVWGHPSVHQSMMAMWPKHVAPPPPPPTHPLPPWSPAGPTFWHSHHHQYVPTTTGTPCYPPQLPPTRFPSRPVVGVPPVGMYKVEPGIAPQTLTKALSDVHPSKESIDAAIGDVIGKPWLPLPLGLKPPSIDSVMSELQRQGVSEIISDTSNVSS